MPSQVIDNYLFSVRNGVRRSLDPRFREIVGDKPVAIFPDELFYLTDGSVNYKVMPTIQNNMTFTSWLDETNAAFFTGGGGRAGIRPLRAGVDGHAAADAGVACNLHGDT